jgi:2-polyprenyl-3-methyl-5-hydroxy-6-metoxy-1,4-benzoquinol methylase
MLAEITADDNGDYYSHIRGEIAQLLPAKVDRVLEIGCGAGDTLAWLKGLGTAQRTYGVELFSDSAEAARRKVDQVICGDFESLELPQDFSGFDVILCLDVLEHFVDPWKALRRIGELLAPGGSIITSIPNVRYFRVVLPLLLQGRWQYENSGILDRTHLRFFTKQTAIELMTSSGLTLDAVSSTGLEKGRKTRYLNWATLGLCKPLFEYQYLIKVSAGQGK